MGQGMSYGIHPKHVDIYNKIIQIKSPATRVQMIETVLMDLQVKQSAQRVGTYGALLQYISTVRSGGRPSLLPGEVPSSVPISSPYSGHQNTLPPPIQIQSNKAQGHVQASRNTNDTFQQQLALRNNGGDIHNGGAKDPFQVLQKANRSEKALNFFTACLRVLKIEEEVALTEGTLKKAYKKAALKAHPDKGGSDAALDAVTRAYAYLSEVLTIVEGKRVGKGKAVTGGSSTRVVPTNMNDAQMMRDRESNDWALKGNSGGSTEGADPIRLNPKNLDMNAFNALFEKMKLPDPENDGYGDWLKGAGGEASAPTFSGKYNRDVFNKVFTEHAVRGFEGEGEDNRGQPESLDLAPTFGTEIGRGGGEHTAPFDSSLGYTDLKSAYTKHNTISNQVANVKLETRTYDAYRAMRERGPDPYNDREKQVQDQWERREKEKERMRQIRAAEQQMAVTSHFDRMKQYAIVDK